MGQSIQEWAKLDLWKTVLSRPYHFKFFKGCPHIPHISLSPFFVSFMIAAFNEFLANGPILYPGITLDKTKSFVVLSRSIKW